MYTEKKSAEVSMQSKADKSTGLTPAKVEEARKKFGLNKLVEQKKKSVFVLFMEQLQAAIRRFGRQSLHTHRQNHTYSQ